MDENHPALVAARSSWRFVQAKEKQGWLGLMAEDVVIEDPIGIAPTNPTGKGIRGKDAVAAFWDERIEPTRIRIEARDSRVAGAESAHFLTLTTSFPNGVKMTVSGIFTYRVNDDGKLQRLRGYWTLDDAEVEQPS